MCALHVAIVCHGNIARSQVFHRYLESLARAQGLDVTFFSCGTAPHEAYPQADLLLRQVQETLHARGIAGKIERTPWSDAAAAMVRQADVILVADRERRAELLDRLGEEVRDRMYLFYEFIAEGSQDYVDTYDPTKGAQDPARFDQLFTEMERMARQALPRLAAICPDR
ncbi:MAG: hypothetical protein EXR62_06570 [Chloroflexi bacterium]|nr:hypothetical protein [Chloroflexota bacterium]